MKHRTPFAVLFACGVVTAGVVGPAAADGLIARSTQAVQGTRLAAGGQRNLVADGQGNAAGTAGNGFTTASGAQGLRSAKFNRTSDGAVSASGQANATGANGGTAERSGSFTRNADGSASGERSTTATNANTGTTFNGSTSYTKGSGFSRSGGCTDAAGNSVSCGPAR
jgi:hypothetical protein